MAVLGLASSSLALGVVTREDANIKNIAVGLFLHCDIFIRFD